MVERRTPGLDMNPAGANPGATFGDTAGRPPIGWAGWIGFAGVMLVLVGACNIVVGLVALNRPEVFIEGPRGVIVFDIAGWGWIHLIAGILQLAIGAGVFSRRPWARAVAVVLAGINALAQLAFLPAFPLWSLIVITLDVVVIWVLLVHAEDLLVEDRRR